MFVRKLFVTYFCHCFPGGAGVLRFLSSDGPLLAPAPPIQNQTIRALGSDGAMQEPFGQNVHFMTADGSMVSDRLGPYGKGTKACYGQNLGPDNFAV